MFSLVRTTGSDPRLPALIAELDADLRARYGELQALGASLNRIKAEMSFVLAIDADGRAIGCGGLRRHDASAIELKRMFVKPSARRHGVARALLGELEAWAREQGFTAIVLETGARQPEAITMYERFGYVRTPPLNVDSPVDVSMRKAL